MKKKRAVIRGNVEKTNWSGVEESSGNSSLKLVDESETSSFPSEKSKFECSICKKSFSDKNCLKKHIKKIHKVEPSPLLQDHVVENKAIRYRCRVCETEFAYKRNLKRHLIKYHSQGLEDEEGGNCFCNVEGCRFRSFFINALRTHLTDEHNLQIDVENKVFPSKKDFDEWKEDEEKTNICLFIKEAGKHKLINGDQRLIYQCHRSGHYYGHGFGKRSFRVKGTCKLGKRCTAGIELTVKERADIHEVVYYKTHIWHQPDVIHVNLSASERAYLADKLKNGTPIASILQSVKGSKDDERTNFCKRIQLLKRKDLINIENTFRLNNTERHIKKQHQRGLKINRDEIRKNLDSRGEVISWVVMSPSEDSECFTVEKLSSEKCSGHCGAVCSFCNACLHMYSCTCHEYLLFSTMCEHIHAVRQSLFPLQGYRKRTSKLYPDQTTSKRRREEEDDSTQTSFDSIPMNTKSVPNDTNTKKTDMINFLNQNFEPQQCESRLQKGSRVKLKQKVDTLGEICSTKIDHIEEDTVHLLTRIVDSALQVIRPPNTSLVSTSPLNEPAPIKMATTAQTSVPFEAFQQQQPLITSAIPNDFVLSTNVTDSILINELLTNRQEDTRSTSYGLPQYHAAVWRKRRKIEDATTAIAVNKPQVFDKRNFYGSPSRALDVDSLSDNACAALDYDAISWHLPALPITTPHFLVNGGMHKANTCILFAS